MHPTGAGAQTPRMMVFSGIGWRWGLVLIGLAVSGLPPALAEEELAVEVTTTSPAYCRHLHDQVTAMLRTAPGTPPDHVTALSAEGRRMCDNGLERGGITRLRHALVILTQPSEPR